MTWSNEIASSIDLAARWAEEHGYQGYDPFDGLGSPLAKRLGAGGKWPGLLRAAWQQAVLRSPVNFRPLLGIHRQANCKAMAYFAMGYLGLYRHRGDERYRDLGVRCLRWLEENGNRNYAGRAWSSPHDYQSRLFFLPRGIPTVVGTCHAARAFIDGYETLKTPRYLEIARSSCDFIMRDLPRYEEDGAVCISYVPTGQVNVHNASMLAAAVLALVHRHTGETDLIHLAEQAVRYTVSHQKPDGSWFYGEAGNLHWVDNFHTGYVLDSLLTYIRISDAEQYLEALRSGLEFFK
ncbi:MAG: hypothetical protein M1565_08275 [Actinobacteria bacterium]|nr:hypothetical protein [Actinomycetota bacterium]